MEMNYVGHIISNGNYRSFLHSFPPFSMFVCTVILLRLLIFCSNYVRAFLLCDAKQEREGERETHNMAACTTGTCIMVATTQYNGQCPLLEDVTLAAHNAVKPRPLI